MSAPPDAFAADQQARIDAINPEASVFLSANAGSGKTTILTNRVIRLLLLPGADPARILCLTYTKAAAAEMQNRIFRELADWVRLEDRALSARIGKLTDQPPDAALMARARQLFAHAVETPGGLKIQTIHAFSERLLHLFPFEANVPVRFQVLDDLSRNEMMERAKRKIVGTALADPDSPMGRAVSLIAGKVGEGRFDTLIAEARNMLRRMRPGFEGRAEALHGIAHRALGIDPAINSVSLAEEMLKGGFGERNWARIGNDLVGIAENKTDKELAAALQRCAMIPDRIEKAAEYAALFLTKERTMRKNFPTTKVAKNAPALFDAFQDEMQRVLDLEGQRVAVLAAERSEALLMVAQAILDLFQREKRQHSLLDFDDMIERAADLVQGDGAAWVLMKLDGGIDHVLIDEAQDTAPAMWRIVEALTDEFFAGASARRLLRTVFAVGDEKQSIYSFQGAAPHAFDAARGLFRKRVEDVGQTFLSRDLRRSFRTVPDILSAVDQVFVDPARRKGLSAHDEPTLHESARQGMPGFVEIWEPVERPLNPDQKAWEEVDALAAGSAEVRLASQIARHTADLIAHGRFDDDHAPIRAGDIMILLQKRGPFFHALLRALKNAGVAVAGADRLRLADQIAVTDLLAAAQFALLPEDDLTLAALLKSPLIGLDDEALMTLCPDRSGALWTALQRRGETEPAIAAIVSRLQHWRLRARYETPYGFFSHLLSSEGGRRALVSRLGPDAAEAIDAFLAAVLDHERLHAPSLQSLVEAFAVLDQDIKRDPEAAGDTVRVMTVHGSKGLEARIVYLPDTHRTPPPSTMPSIYTATARDPLGKTMETLLWSLKSEGDPEPLQAERQRIDGARQDEYRRLLYVAMTRARDRLYIAGIRPKQKETSTDLTPMPPGSWFAMIAAALDERLVEIATPAGGTVRRWQSTPARPGRPEAKPTATVAQGVAEPAWLHRAAPVEIAAQPPIRPSRVIEAADHVAAERLPARLRGNLVHDLLECLPGLPGERQNVAALAYLGNRAPTLPLADRAGLARDVLDLMHRPDLAALFGPDGQAEVTIAGKVMRADGREQAVLGRIDRLLVTPTTVWIIDFKTGLPPRSGHHTSHLIQLGLYRALMAEIYPAHTVEAGLLWTQIPRLDRIEPDLLTRALEEIAGPALDPEQRRS